MNLTTRIALLVCCLAVTAGPARGDELPPEVRASVEKGLNWLEKTQHRDGHWEGNGGQYRTPMTALAGMALLMEGSTLREGKYSNAIRKTVDWFLEPGRVQRNGLIGNPNHQSEAARYMYGHGFGLLFLASVYGEEEDAERRRKLEEILSRAVLFTVKAQHGNGGWGYLSAADNDRFDEGSVTITQVQALRAARNAGIPVPKQSIDSARKYLEGCTTDKGGVLYRPGQPGERPALTAAAIACMFNAGEYEAPIVKKWWQFCQTSLGDLGSGGGRIGHDEYAHYYYAQCLYIIGDDGYAKLFPETRGKPDQQLMWSRYRKGTFDFLIKNQSSDGSWSGSGRWGHIGPVYTSSMFLAILQLDNSVLPIYQR